jgi:16S rRNA G1207 methylase RsmC
MVPRRQVYDRVVMNPPFDRERDVDHVMHALGFLKPGGRLVAVMSAHTEFAESRKATAFRAHIKKLGGRFSDLPRNSFSEVGTNVNTILLTVSI